MVALVIFAIALGYFALAVACTVAAMRRARASGMPRWKRVATGGAVGLAFYLVPFWDFIPTLAAHRYYCAKEAKFEIRKSIDQWKSENMGVLRDLRYDQDAQITSVGKYRRFPLNQRLAVERVYATKVFLAVRRQEGRIIDLKSSEVLAEYVEFITGYGPFSVGGEGAWKFWLDMGACTGEFGFRADFERFEQAIQELGKRSR